MAKVYRLLKGIRTNVGIPWKWTFEMNVLECYDTETKETTDEPLL